MLGPLAPAISWMDRGGADLGGAAMNSAAVRARVGRTGRFRRSPRPVWVARLDAVVLGVAVLVLANLLLSLALPRDAPPASVIQPVEGTPEWVAAALASTVGTPPAEVTAALFAADAVLAEWRPGGQYWEASDAGQRRAWLEEQIAAGRRLSADHLHVRGAVVAWRALALSDEDLAFGRVPEERASVVALDEHGRIRSWTLYPLDLCAGPEAAHWPCAALLRRPGA